MARLIALSLLVIPFVSGGAVRAGEPQSICRNPSVLTFIGLELQKRDHYARVVPCLVEEFPTAAQDIVQCGIAVRSVTYNAALRPDVPFGRCENHAFRVRALPNGFVVDYLR